MELDLSSSEVCDNLCCVRWDYFGTHADADILAASVVDDGNLMATITSSLSFVIEALIQDAVCA